MKEKEKEKKFGISLACHRKEVRIAEMIKSMPSHVYEIDASGKSVLVPRNSEVAEKEREWNEMYDKAMSLLREARKARRFGHIPEYMQQKLAVFGSKFMDWQRDFYNYEKEVQPVVSDRREYLIKGWYLEYYAHHTISFWQRLDCNRSCYYFAGAFHYNPIGCQVLFSEAELDFAGFSIPFTDTLVFDPRVLSLFTKYQEKKLKGRIRPFSRYSYNDFSDTGQIPRDQVTREEIDGMSRTDDFYCRPGEGSFTVSIHGGVPVEEGGLPDNDDII